MMKDTQKKKGRKKEEENRKWKLVCSSRALTLGHHAV
jgi:hypothetical protein